MQLVVKVTEDVFKGYCKHVHLKKSPLEKFRELCLSSLQTGPKVSRSLHNTYGDKELMNKMGRFHTHKIMKRVTKNLIVPKNLLDCNGRTRHVPIQGPRGLGKRGRTFSESQFSRKSRLRKQKDL